MRRKYSTFIKILGVILIIVISSITNRYASEVKSLEFTSTINNHRNNDVEDSPQNQPIMFKTDLDSQDRLPAEYAKEDESSLKAPTYQTSERSLVDLNDSQGKSIYSSLMKILQNMKNQMDRGEENKLSDRMDRKKVSSLTSIIDVPMVELVRSSQTTKPTTSQPNENKFNNNNNDYNYDQVTTKAPKRNVRNTKKTSGQTSSPLTVQADTLNQDQGSQDMFNEPLRENLNEMGDNLASMLEDENARAKKAAAAATYSSYLGPTLSDQQVTTTTTSNTKTNSNQLNIHRKPVMQTGVGNKQYNTNNNDEAVSQTSSSSSLGGNKHLSLQPQTRMFSPRVEDFAPSLAKSSWNHQQSSTFFNDDAPLPPTRPLFTISGANKNSPKPSSPQEESFFAPNQQDSILFNDYDQTTSGNGFSTEFNEAPSSALSSSSQYQSAGSDMEPDPPMDSSAPQIMTSSQRTTSPRANRVRYLGTNNNRQIRFKPSTSVGGFSSHTHERPQFNSHHYIDNEFLNAGQLEQQEEDGSRWPKASPQAPEFQESLRAPSRPRESGTNDYRGIHLQQIHPPPPPPVSSSTTTTTTASQGKFYNQQPAQNHRNKRQRSHNHQAQQQQVYYSLVSAPPQQTSILKGFNDQQQSLANVGGRATTIVQQATIPTRQIYQISPSGISQMSAAAGVQPMQRDLVNQPQTIQITAVPGLGFANQNPSVIRLNGLGGPTVNGIALSNLINNNNGALLDPTNRQVLMVNADRRQIDWSFLIWPLLVVIVLPLVLSALFVPIFMKSLVLFLQILQSLGLVMPISGALGLSLASGASFANVTSTSK